MNTPFTDRAVKDAEDAEGYYMSMFPQASGKNGHAAACRRTERALLTALQTIETMKERLRELPNLILENEKKNPAWSKAELWGIERDIIPSLKLLCMSAEHVGDDIWKCEHCGIYFIESDSPGVDIAPDCEEHIVCCPCCYRNAVDDFDTIHPATPEETKFDSTASQP